MHRQDTAPRAVSGIVTGAIFGFTEHRGRDPGPLTSGLGVTAEALRTWHCWFPWDVYLALEARFDALFADVPDRYTALGEFVVTHRRLGVGSLLLRAFSRPAQAYRLIPALVPRLLLAGASAELSETGSGRLELTYRFPSHISPTAGMAEVIRGQLVAGPTALGHGPAAVSLVAHETHLLRYAVEFAPEPVSLLERARQGARQAGRRLALLRDLGGELLRTNALLGEKLEELEEANARLLEEVASRHSAVAAARSSEARYRLLAETAHDIIAVLEPDLTVRYVNRYGAVLAGSAPEALVGRRLGELIPPAQAKLAGESVLEALSTGHPVRRSRAFRVGDEERWLDSTLVPIEGPDGHTDAVLAVVRDVSGEKRAEKEQARLEAQVQHAQKLESLGVLAGGIAHDFNNLLTVVLGNAEVALGQVTPEHPLARHLGAVADAARRGAELCRLMLAYAGKGIFRERAVDLGRAVRDLEGLLRTSVPRKAELRFEFPEGLPAVGGDPTQLRQVALNLVVNAAESLDGGAGSLVVRAGLWAPSAAEIEAAVLAPPQPLAPSYVFLEVEDTGCGMDEETRARAFDPFFTTKFTGRGLGLAAVLGIVRRHGGLLSLESEVGRGTRVRIGLPEALDLPEDSWDRIPVEGLRRGGEAPSAAHPSRGAVLLVDDEREIREVGQSILEELGFEVLTAGDGREALERFSERGAALRAVILDVTMPGMDGEEAFRALRERAPELPILLISGHGALEVEARFHGLQPYQFLPKPYTVAELRGALGAVLLQELDAPA